ncbi:hypothetical protein E2320_020174, partial [Naja naja]
WSKEYGPIFRIKLGFQEMVVLTGYETVKEALVNQADAFADRASVPIFEDARTIEDKITEECSFLTKTMETYAGKPFDITTILSAAVSNIIVCILLGKRYEYEDATFLRLLKIVNENLQLSGSPAVLLYNLFPKLGFLLGASRKILKNEKELHDFIRTTFENMKMTHGGFFHNENLIGLVDDLFTAGTDTTANTLRWAILLMMKYPDIQRKVQEEIAKEIGDTQPRTDHRAKMPYTDAGMYIIPLLTSVLHDESQWEKPHEFYPEHFLDSQGKFVKRDAFMPFSAGRRICAGETLAKMELFLFFTSLLKKFTFRPPPGISKDDLDLTPCEMDWTAVISILLLFFPAIMFLLKRGRSWNNSSLNLPPGPRTIPLLGNLHMMDLKKPSKTMMEWSKEYGPIFRIKLGSQEMVVLTGYETVKEALVNQADVFSDRPAVPIFEDTTQGFGKPFDVTRILTAAVSNIIVSILLGKRYEYEDATFLRLLKLVRENIHLLGSPAVLLYNLFPKLGFLLGAHKTIVKNQKEIHDFIQTTFIKYLQDLDENDQRNFIESFLENMKMGHGGYFHNKNLIGIVNDLFGAGTDTMGQTLRWAILLMMKYPEIQSKIQAEIAREIGDIQPRTDHRAKMPYTDAVIHECQRFANIVPSNLPHATTMDITFKGFFIPKGMYIIPLLSSVLHDESQWEKPHEFYPEHFLDSEGKFVKRDAFMPFSAGRRVCAGENLARMELFLFFASLLQRFTFQPPSGTSKDDLDLTPVVGITSIPMPYKTCAMLR